MLKRIFALWLCAAMLILCAGTLSCAGRETRTSVFPAAAADTLPQDISLTVLEAVPEPEPEPEPEIETQTVSFLAAGDAIVHTGIMLEAKKTAADRNEGKTYDFSHLFTRVRDEIASYDIAFINQETLMAGEEYGYSSYPRFNTPRELAAALIDTGFNVVNIANNHMMDMLPEGLASTIAFWQTQPVTLIGGYLNTEDYHTPRIIEQNGVTIAFLSYCYGTNGLSMPAGYDMVIPYLDEETIRAQTARAAEAADFVVVSVHWGEDSVQAVTADQKFYAQLFADCGVDVVVGHHPHLIQPIEWIDGCDGSRTLCVYSLGNLFSLMADAYNMVGGFLTLDFVKEGDECRVENVCFMPTVFYYNTGFFGQKIYKMEDYSEALASSHGVQTYGAYHLASWAKLVSYTKQLIAEEFLPDSIKELAP